MEAAAKAAAVSPLTSVPGFFEFTMKEGVE